MDHILMYFIEINHDILIAVRSNATMHVIFLTDSVLKSTNNVMHWSIMIKKSILVADIQYINEIDNNTHLNLKLKQYEPNNT